MFEKQSSPDPSPTPHTQETATAPPWPGTETLPEEGTTVSGTVERRLQKRLPREDDTDGMPEVWNISRVYLHNW